VGVCSLHYRLVTMFVDHRWTKLHQLFHVYASHADSCCKACVAYIPYLLELPTMSTDMRCTSNNCAALIRRHMDTLIGSSKWVFLYLISYMYLLLITLSKFSELSLRCALCTGVWGFFFILSIAIFFVCSNTIQYNILLLQSQTDRCESDIHNDM